MRRSEKIVGLKHVAVEVNVRPKKTRKREVLEQMDEAVPWAALV